MTAGPRGPQLLQDVWFLEKLAHFDREVIPERRMHAKGSGAYGTFTVTHDITQYTRARIFSKIGKKTDVSTWLYSSCQWPYFFLHDGRARDLMEAILWHGGEAESAKEYFRMLSSADREALIKFLESL
jgi:hypothetical protein